MPPPRDRREFRLAKRSYPTHNWGMEVRIARLIAFTMTAGMAALVLAFLTHHEFGLSRHTIRTDALISAMLTGTMLLIAVFGHKADKPK